MKFFQATLLASFFIIFHISITPMQQDSLSNPLLHSENELSRSEEQRSKKNKAIIDPTRSEDPAQADNLEEFMPLKPEESAENSLNLSVRSAPPPKKESSQTRRRPSLAVTEGHTQLLPKKRKLSTQHSSNKEEQREQLALSQAASTDSHEHSPQKNIPAQTTSLSFIESQENSPSKKRKPSIAEICPALTRTPKSLQTSMRSNPELNDSLTDQPLQNSLLLSSTRRPSVQTKSPRENFLDENFSFPQRRVSKQVQHSFMLPQTPDNKTNAEDNSSPKSLPKAAQSPESPLKILIDNHQDNTINKLQKALWVTTGIIAVETTALGAKLAESKQQQSTPQTRMIGEVAAGAGLGIGLLKGAAGVAAVGYTYYKVRKWLYDGYVKDKDFKPLKTSVETLHEISEMQSAAINDHSENLNILNQADIHTLEKRLTEIEGILWNHAEAIDENSDETHTLAMRITTNAHAVNDNASILEELQNLIEEIEKELQKVMLRCNITPSKHSVAQDLHALHQPTTVDSNPALNHDERGSAAVPQEHEDVKYIPIRQAATVTGKKKSFFDKFRCCIPSTSGSNSKKHQTTSDLQKQVAELQKQLRNSKK